MDDPIKRVQEHLDETARRCLRVIAAGKLTKSQSQSLSKFMFGCMNQKHELPRRVAERGPGELAKVLEFIARACEALVEIDEANRR